MFKEKSFSHEGREFQLRNTVNYFAYFSHGNVSSSSGNCQTESFVTNGKQYHYSFEETLVRRTFHFLLTFEYTSYIFFPQLTVEALKIHGKYNSLVKSVVTSSMSCAASVSLFDLLADLLKNN